MLIIIDLKTMRMHKNKSKSMPLGIVCIATSTKL